jgi:4-amino-4-deoxy-L-arabinose transferase-like glycosyltransferase
MKTNQSAKPGLQRFLPLLIVVGVAGVVGSASLIYPLGRDQGAYALIANSVRQGAVMYRDVLVDTPPLTILVYIAVLTLFGHSMFPIRIVDLLVVAATAGLVFGFTSRVFGRKWLAVAAGVLYSYLYYLHDFWHTAQPDGFANLPIALALLLGVIADGKRERHGVGWYWAAIGAASVLAVLFRQTLWLLVPGLAGFALLGRGTGDEGRGTGVESRRANWSGLAWFGGGAAAVALGLVVWLAASGALPSFLKTVFGVPALGGGQDSGYSAGAGRIVQTLGSYLLAPDFCVGGLLGSIGLVLVVVLLLRSQTPDSTRRGMVLLLCVVVAALFSVSLQGGYQFYQYLPLLPASAVLNALALFGILAPAWPRLVRSYQRVGFAPAIW